jgi:polysaccharide export outer membrane protein
MAEPAALVTKAGWGATVAGGNLASAVVVGTDAPGTNAPVPDGPWAAVSSPATAADLPSANVTGATVSSAAATAADVNGASVVKAGWSGIVQRAPRDVQVSPAPVAWGAAVITPYLPPQPPPGLGPYLLDTGDKLRVFVYGQPSLSRLYTVDQSGYVAIPLIGNVRARDRTTTELARAIADRLGREFVRDPQVTVDVALNRPFFILGEVRLPGQYPYVSGMAVETAVAIAGGYTERASQRCFRITRRFHNGLVDQIEAPADYILRPGDTVYVYERYF